MLKIFSTLLGSVANGRVLNGLRVIANKAGSYSPYLHSRYFMHYAYFARSFFNSALRALISFLYSSTFCFSFFKSASNLYIFKSYSVDPSNDGFLGLGISKESSLIHIHLLTVDSSTASCSSSMIWS
jgi:hypothetical protein